MRLDRRIPRVAATALAALLMAAAPAGAADEALEAVAGLETVLAKPDAEWSDVYAAYRAAREALDGIRDRAQAADAAARRALAREDAPELALVYDAAQTALKAYALMLGTHGADDERTQDTHASFEAARAALVERDVPSGAAVETALEALRVGEAAVEAPLNYDEIRPRVATRLRRESLPADGWVMGLFGAGLMWGGLLFCIVIARRRGSGPGGEEPDEG